MKVRLPGFAAIVIVTAFVGATCLEAAEIDVRSYGAKCDGSSNDAGAIQNAINALASGDTLTIPAPSGIGSPGLRLSGKTSVTIRGTNGGGFIALSTVPQSCLLLVENCSTCTLKDLTVDNRNQAVSAFIINRSTATLFQNNSISNTGYAQGMYAFLNMNNKYIGNRINITGFKSDHTDGGRGMWIGNWQIEDINPLVENNSVRNAAGTGIASHTVGGTFRGNVCEDNAGAGIKNVPKPGTTASTLIEHNQLRRNLYNGLQIDLGHHMTVRNNAIEANGEQGMALYSDIPTAPLKDLTIESNTIINNNTRKNPNWGAAAILVHDGGENLIFRNNIIDDYSTGHPEVIGIWLYNARGPIKNVLIEGNSSKRNVRAGVLVGGAGQAIDGLTLRNNVCSANSWGLYFTRGSAITIQNISVVGNDLGGNSIAPIYDDTGLNITNEPGTDITPPLISAVASSAVTQTGATINWTTNEAADTQVEYGLTTSYGSTTTLTTTKLTAHSQALSGLSAGTLYHYRVKSRDAAGNLATSADYSFVTVRSNQPPTLSSAATALPNPANVGQSISFTVAAIDSDGDALSYSWTFGDGASAAGASVSHAYASAGTYGASLRVSDGMASVSSTVSVQVNAAAVAPTITTHPANVSVAVAQSAAFNVVAAGTAPLSYQWQKNGTNITGATGAAYTSPPVTVSDNGALFRCVVSNSAGTATSGSATLTVTFQAPTTGSFIAGFTPGTVVGGGTASYFAGMKFTVGANPLTLTHLGRMMLAGNSRVHTLKLVQAASNTDLAGGSVTMNMAGNTVGKFVYAALPAPITLQANTAYYLVSNEVEGADYFYDWNATVRTSPVATVNAAVNNGRLWGGGNNSYGPLDFKYSTANQPPAITAGPTATPNPAMAGQSVTFALAASDPEAQVLSYEWSFGDGTSAAGASVSHAYLSAGTYNVAVRVSDGVNSVSRTISVQVHAPVVMANFITGFTPRSVVGGGRASYWCGMKFTVGSSPLTLTHLGRMMLSGNSRTHTLKLQWASSGSDVPGGSVSINMAGKPVGQFVYAQLATPVLLNANTAYLLVSNEVEGADAFYDWNASVRSTAVATVNAGVNGGRLFGTTGNSYGPMDFKYSQLAAAAMATAGEDAPVVTDLGTISSGKPLRLSLPAPQALSGLKRLSWSLEDKSQLPGKWQLSRGKLAAKAVEPGTYVFAVRVAGKTIEAVDGSRRMVQKSALGVFRLTILPKE